MSKELERGTQGRAYLQRIGENPYVETESDLCKLEAGQKPWSKERFEEAVGWCESFPKKVLDKATLS